MAMRSAVQAHSECAGQLLLHELLARSLLT